MNASMVATGQLSVRQIRALLRQPVYLFSFLVQPIIWLLLFGQLFKRVVEIPGFTAASYISFLTPGVVVMTALYANGWAGMGLIIDMDRGVMDRFLVSPVRRGALIAGSLGYQGAVTVLQSLTIVGLGMLTGARFPGGALSVAAFVVCAALLGSAFAAFSNAIALLVRRQESVIGVVNFLVLPLSFLSTAFMPRQLMPGWMQALARLNPVTWAVEVGRQPLQADVDWALVLSRGGWLLALAVIAGVLAMRAFRLYQRSV
jgi:ABC-2 type transport system permease protein